MRVFLAVLLDLWEFVTGKETKSGNLLLAPNNSLSEIRVQAEEVEVSTASSVLSDEKLQLVEPVTSSFSPTPAPILEDTAKAYVVAKEANVMLRPVWAFDSVISKARFGDSVIVFDYSGRFARVKYKETTGWILKDEITSDYKNVVPDFVPSKIYLANDVETKKLRSTINDEFFTADLYLPLLGVEYVAYKLFSLNRTINWSEERPRLAGNWQNILKGRLGIHIGIQPKTGSVMEYVDSEGEGRLGYVEAVKPDDSILLSSVGRLTEGQFLHEEISKDVWLDLRPVWIQIQ